MPELCCDINKLTPVGLKYLFKENTEMNTDDVYYPKKPKLEIFYAPTEEAKFIEFRIHYLPDGASKIAEKN